MNVRVRFAPSPTGYLHVGGLRTALYDYLFAKIYNGKYVLRIEDTDQSRLVKDATISLVNTLNYLEIRHDEGPQFDSGSNLYTVGDYGPYIQSSNLEKYKETAETLVKSSKAYRCFCSKERLDNIRNEQRKNGQTPRYDGFCRNISEEESQKRIEKGEPYVIRLKLPEKTDITFTDKIRGKVTFNTEDLDDQVLIKQDGFPTYHLAVVVDDNHMKISHVIRGEEWLSSTPKHIALYDALCFEKPEYIHLPLILNSEKKKLSKRHDDVSVEKFIEDGYLKEALVNYVALLGWSPEDDVEIMSLDDIIAKFNFEKLSHSSAVFSIDKLKWVNASHIRDMDIEKLEKRAVAFMKKYGSLNDDYIKNEKEKLRMMVEAFRERSETLMDFALKSKFFFEDYTLPEDGARKHLETEGTKEVIEAFIKELNDMSEINIDNAKKPFTNLQKNHGFKAKEIFMRIRVALSGQSGGVDMNAIMIILGKDKIIHRLKKTLENFS